MQLPAKISPNPLLTSTVELRLNSKYPREEILAKVLSHFLPSLPILKEGPIPYQVREDDPKFEYTPDFILSNKDFSLSFSHNMISFESVGEYKLWPNYFGFIMEQLNSLCELAVFQNVIRIGVRYASIFDGVKEINNCLKNTPVLSVEGFNTDGLRLIASKFRKEDAIISLQLRPNTKIVKESGTLLGLVVDIDVSKTFSENTAFDNGVFATIDAFHSIEKDFLFNGLLKEDFVASLSPEY